MQKLTRMMIICLLAIVLTSAVYIEVIAMGDCPSCWYYQCDEGESRCIGACLTDSEDGYYFHVAYHEYLGNYTWATDVTYVHMLMWKPQVSWCESPCEQYTAKATKGGQVGIEMLG